MMLATEGLRVAEVACAGGPSGWSAEEPIAALSIVLVRSGLFRRRVDGVELVADPMIAYLQRPGSIQQVAHPCGGDSCTVIEPSAAVCGDLAESPELLSDQLVIRADLDVDHRALLARARLGVNSFELLERATALARRASGNALTSPVGPMHVTGLGCTSLAWYALHGAAGCGRGPPGRSGPSAAAPRAVLGAVARVIEDLADKVLRPLQV
jgi:hypothetical protein